MSEALNTRELENDYAETSEIVSKSFSPIDETFSAAGNGLWQQETKAWMDLMTLKSLFFNEGWVFILIDRIASKIASQELRVMKQTGIKNGRKTFEPDEGHPLQDLIYNPNDHQTYYQWMYSIIADYSVAGNAIVWHAPLTSQLVHIPIETIQLDFDRDGMLYSYRVIQFNTEYDIPVPRTLHAIPRDQVAHFRRPNPSSTLWGLSPFLPGRASVLFNRYSKEYLNNFYIKGAQPGFVFELSQEANEQNVLRMLRSVELAHTGRKNQRRNMVVPKGVSVKNLSYSLSDQALLDHVAQNREEIINILAVPKHELSINESGSLGAVGEEYKIALRNFWKGPLKSMMRAIEGSLTKLFADQLGEDRFLEFDLSDVDVLQEDVDRKADTATKLLTTHTLNEVRSIVFEMEPLPGGDTPPIPPAARTPSTPALPSFAFEAPKEECKSEDPVPQTAPEPSLDRMALHRESNFKAFTTYKEQNPGWWQKREDMLKKKTEDAFVAFHRHTLDLFSKQVEAALKIVTKNLHAQGFKGLITKEEDFKSAKLRRELERAIQDFEEGYTEEGIKILESVIDTGYDAQLTLPFNIPNRSEIEALRSKNAAKRRDMLERLQLKRFAGLSATTSEAIMKIIENGVTNSLSVQDIASQIKREFSDIENIDSRANTISRTEVLTATSLGQAAAMQDAASVIPDLKKMWITADDERVRGRPDGLYPNASDNHWELRGEFVPQDEAFSNGLQYPRDPAGEAGQVINCRCSWVMISGADAEKIGVSEFQNELETASPLQDTGE